MAALVNHDWSDHDGETLSAVKKYSIRIRQMLQMFQKMLKIELTRQLGFRIPFASPSDSIIQIY